MTTPEDRVTEQIRGRVHRTRGQSTVELAFAAPIFMLLVIGMIEYGRAMMIHHTITNAAREGARVGAFSGSDAGTVQTAVDKYLNGGGLESAKAQITISGAKAASGSDVAVTINYPYTSIVLELIHASSNSLTLSANSTMIHE
ncbi:MAG: pilus assembly protein [Acidobacteria bacterium]|nr:pilus assembly protein [Acidobacteriota bacterium]